MPKQLTADTGMDVLAHVTEAAVARGDHPLTDLFSYEAIRLVSQNLLPAYENSDMQARANMAIADSYAGLAISLSGTVLPHAMSHPISANYPEIAHGAALASITPAIIDFNLKKADDLVRERYARIANAMGGKKDSSDVVPLITKLEDKLGERRSLSELGVKDPDFDKMAEDSMRYMLRAVQNNPVDASKQDIANLFHKSF